MLLKFAKARPSQHAEIYTLMEAAFTPYVQNFGHSAAGPYPWLEAAIAGQEVFIALDGAEIVGAVTTIIREADLAIEQLAVDPHRQGQGIGSFLLGQLEQNARDTGATSLSLNTAEMMTGLLRLSSRHGFVETRRELPAHGDDDHLRVFMTKRL